MDINIIVFVLELLFIQLHDAFGLTLYSIELH